MDPRDTRQFQADAETWTVTRVVRRPKATYQATRAYMGLHFTSSKDVRRFLPLASADLPSGKELRELTEARLRELLALAH